ncbi:MAG: C4-dicarboxylate TRAP transporter substrate-binding protein [Myxococcota bacterium]
MKNLLKAGAMIAFVSFIYLPFAYSAEEMRFGTMAPEGSSWYNILKEFTKGVENKTNKEVKFKIYAGTLGDEKTILKRMRAKKLEGAGFTGIGLGEIYPGIRILEQPMLFRNYEEVDFVTEKIWTYLEKKFEEQGFVLLGRGEAGFVNLFTNKPVKEEADFQGIKLWVWEGDPVAKGLVDVFGIVPIYLSLPDVLTALQTNRIDACYAPPLAAMAFQWHTKVKFYTDIPLANSIGAMVVTKESFDKLNAEQQEVMKKYGWAAGKKIVQTSRRDNKRAYEELEKMGIKKVDVQKSDYEKIEKAGLRVRKSLVGKLYNQEMLDLVEGYLREYRKGK